MPDTPFKAMGRETRQKREQVGEYMAGQLVSTVAPPVEDFTFDSLCERCLAYIRHGDWPFCTGDPDQHRRE